MTKSEDGADLVSAISATSSKKAPGSFLQAFGQRIVEARMRKGWTRVELAGEMGVSRDRLAKWERGESAPPLDMLIALHGALGGSLHELVTGEPPPKTVVLSPAQREELEGHLEALDRLLGEMKPLPDLTTGDDAQGEKP